MSIVARNKENLQKALTQIEVPESSPLLRDVFASFILTQASRVNPNQILRAYSFSLGTQEAASEALEAACVPHGGQTPDAVFLCAGKSTPGFFIEQTEESMRNGMEDSYWPAACSAMVCNLLEPAFYLGLPFTKITRWPLSGWCARAPRER